MRVKPLPPRQKKIFYACIGVTVALVLAGWFFSFQRLWFSLDFSTVSFSGLIDLKNGVKEIGGELKNNFETTADEVTPAVQEVISTANEIKEQQQTATENVGNIMKENFENQYGQTQENN